MYRESSRIAGRKGLVPRNISVDIEQGTDIVPTSVARTTKIVEFSSGCAPGRNASSRLPFRSQAVETSCAQTRARSSSTPLRKASWLESEPRNSVPSATELENRGSRIEEVYHLFKNGTAQIALCFEGIQQNLHDSQVSDTFGYES